MSESETEVTMQPEYDDDWGAYNVVEVGEDAPKVTKEEDKHDVIKEAVTQESDESAEEISNEEVDEPLEEKRPKEVDHNAENMEEGKDAVIPESEAADLEAAYSYFADNDVDKNDVNAAKETEKKQGPNIVEEEKKNNESNNDVDSFKYPATFMNGEDNNNQNVKDSPQEEINGNNQDGGAEEANNDTAPRKKRNSLIGRVKTVNEEGDTDEPDEEEEGEEEDEDPWVISDSNLRDPQRRICVVTTAALPWRTGTAVNPLLRALYLTRGRPKHYVTLVIPWCPEEDDRNKTLGRQHAFSNQAEQEEWIRDFCRVRANCEEEEKNLKIMFYTSNYNESMGSIFPSVDICSLIPDNEADVAILEEPEHLNWLRIPAPYKGEENDTKDSPKTANKKIASRGKKRTATAKDKAELGWRFKFRHVVGIVHTNYKAYAEQYGIGAKFITAPALCALNALVVRAYCHKVILLSGTLPSLTPYKEIICNVHGVRGEFLERPTDSKAVNPKSVDDEEQHASVYFIGKLIWAKGFDKILDLENLYREKHDDYFPIDVYGAGGDEKAIKRAFFGRIPQIQRSDSSKSSDEENASTPDSNTAEVFTWETSLRSHLVEQTPFKESEKHECLDDHLAKRRSSIIDPDEIDTTEIEVPPETPRKRGSILENLSENVVPLSVLGNLSASALDTTKATGGAAVAVVKNVVGAGLNVAFTNDVGSPHRVQDSSRKKPKQKLIFDPPQSIFEFRRNPIQARFLGSKDHMLLRDTAEHKVFLNMSITEVLCTTSAEALAMGKFVLLPKHPSNTFFLQFPNCLAYTSLEDCLEKLEWALAHDPVPMSEASAKKLSWEGANERLFDSSAVTRDEWEEWAETGKLRSDDDAARFHVETGMKGQLIGKFFTGDKSKEESEAES